MKYIFFVKQQKSLPVYSSCYSKLSLKWLAYFFNMSADLEIECGHVFCVIWLLKTIVFRNYYPVLIRWLQCRFAQEALCFVLHALFLSEIKVPYVQITDLHFVQNLFSVKLMTPHTVGHWVPQSSAGRGRPRPLLWGTGSLRNILLN